MHILHVVGARPNFMKLAPVFTALRETSGIRQCLVHTGQHYDTEMSDVFFRELGLPEPDINLGIGSDSGSAAGGAIAGVRTSGPHAAWESPGWG